MTLEHEPLRKVIRKLQDERDEAVREVERLQDTLRRKNTAHDVIREFPAAWRTLHGDMVALWPGTTKKEAQAFILGVLDEAVRTRTAEESEL